MLLTHTHTHWHKSAYMFTHTCIHYWCNICGWFEKFNKFYVHTPLSQFIHSFSQSASRINNNTNKKNAQTCATRLLPSSVWQQFKNFQFCEFAKFTNISFTLESQMPDIGATWLVASGERQVASDCEIAKLDLIVERNKLYNGQWPL